MMNHLILDTILLYIENEYTMLNILTAVEFLRESIPTTFRLDLSIHNFYTLCSLEKLMYIKNISINYRIVENRANIFSRLKILELEGTTTDNTITLLKNNENLEKLTIRQIYNGYKLKTRDIEHLNLKKIKLINHNMKEFDRVPNSVRSLTIIDCDHLDTNIFQGNITLKKLILNCSYNPMKNIISKLTSLEKLHLSYSDIDISSLSTLTRLKSLSLIDEYVIDSNIFSGMKSLYKLKLSNCDIRNINNDLQIHSVIKFRIGNIHTDTDIDRTRRIFPNCLTIKNESKTWSMKIPLKVYNYNNCLRKLNLFHSQFNEAIFIDFVNLESLSLTRCNNYTGGSLKYTPNIKKLTIDSCENFQIRYIQTCVNLLSLRVVNNKSKVPNNLLKDIDRIHTVELIDIPDLHNKFLKHLVRKRIYRLSLRNCKKINYQSLKSLYKFYHLNYLDIFLTCISDDTENIFRYKYHINMYNSV